MWAARGERAAWRQRSEVGRVAPGLKTGLAPEISFRVGGGAAQQLGVGVAGLTQHRPGWARLQQVPGVHDGDAVAHVGGPGQVVGNEKQ